MKMLRQATLVMTTLLIAMVVMVLVGPSAALATGLANPSFETGDLSGWITSIPFGGSANATMSYGSYTAVDGSYFALLKTNGDGIPTTVSQTFSASAGDKISGWAFFKAEDYMPYNDNTQVVIRSGGSVVATVFSASVSSVGDFGSTPWTYWEYTFTASGMYVVEARIANYGDPGWDSRMGLEMLTGLGPKNLKQDAIDKLSLHAGESKKIDKAIKEIEKSLDDKLWIDDTHIDPKHGKKVFDRERHSVKELMHLLKGIPDDGKFGGVSLIELEYTVSGTVVVEVYLKNLLLGTFTVSTGDTFVVEATEDTGWKLHPEIKLIIDSVEVAKIHTSGSKPLDIGDVHGDFIIADLDKLPPKSGKKDQVSDEALTAAETAIDQLVRADRILAGTKLEEARSLTPLDPVRQEKFEKEIAKADDELAKGDADRDSGKFDKAISHYKKAWEHANHAEKEATKPPKP